eukprot:8157243-Pyramimonas_sp.AAC.1
MCLPAFPALPVVPHCEKLGKLEKLENTTRFTMTIFVSSWKSWKSWKPHHGLMGWSLGKLKITAFFIGVVSGKSGYSRGSWKTQSSSDIVEYDQRGLIVSSWASSTETYNLLGSNFELS